MLREILFAADDNLDAYYKMLLFSFDCGLKVQLEWIVQTSGSQRRTKQLLLRLHCLTVERIKVSSSIHTELAIVKMKPYENIMTMLSSIVQLIRFFQSCVVSK